MTIELRKNNPKLAELIEARKKLLEEKPELAELQFKINDLMAGAGSYHNRVLLLKRLMYDNLAELKSSLQDLQLAVYSLTGEEKSNEEKSKKD